MIDAFDRVDIHNLGKTNYLMEGGRLVPARGVLSGLVFAEVPSRARADAQDRPGRTQRLKIVLSGEKIDGSQSGPEVEDSEPERIVGNLPHESADPLEGPVEDSPERTFRRRPSKMEPTGERGAKVRQAEPGGGLVDETERTDPLGGLPQTSILESAAGEEAETADGPATTKLREWADRTSPTNEREKPRRGRRRDRRTAPPALSEHSPKQDQ